MSVGSTPLPRIPPGFPWRPRRKTESPAGWRDPAEELPRPDERSDARRGRRVTILLGVTDVSGCAQAHAVETGQLEEHPRSWLAAVAAVRVRVGAEAVVAAEVSPFETRAWLETMKHASKRGRSRASVAPTLGMSTGWPVVSTTVRLFLVRARVPPQSRKRARFEGGIARPYHAPVHRRQSFAEISRYRHTIPS